MYVGDAAGRPKEGGRKRADFAASDWKFAMNLKVDFKTPEGYFLNSKAVRIYIENTVNLCILAPQYSISIKSIGIGSTNLYGRVNSLFSSCIHYVFHLVITYHVDVGL